MSQVLMFSSNKFSELVYSFWAFPLVLYVKVAVRGPDPGKTLNEVHVFSVCLY